MLSWWYCYKMWPGRCVAETPVTFLNDQTNLDRYPDASRLRCKTSWCLVSRVQDTSLAKVMTFPIFFPVPGDFPVQRPVTRSFDVFFDLRSNKRLSKQSWGWWLRHHRAHYDVTVICLCNRTKSNRDHISLGCNIAIVLFQTCCYWACIGIPKR